MKKLLLILLFACTSAAAQIAGVKYSTCIDFVQADVPITASPVALSARASSGEPVTYSSKTPTTCGVSAGVATLRLAGVCTIVAKTAATTAYMAGQTPLSFNVTAVVTPPPPPATAPLSIRLVSPVPTGDYSVGQAITFDAAVTGTATRVEFHSGGNLLVSLAAPPWKFVYTPTTANANFEVYAEVSDGVLGFDRTPTLKINIKPAVIVPPPVAKPWTAQQAFFAACGACPATGKIETATCAGFDIVAIDGGVCVDSTRCKWQKL